MTELAVTAAKISFHGCWQPLYSADVNVVSNASVHKKATKYISVNALKVR